MEHSPPGGNPTSSKRIYKVVLTGGPCGGKTTGQSRLCTFFENLGWKVYRVPETATILLSGGVKFAELSEAEALKFQENLLLAMLNLERVYFDLAASSRRNCLIICDRGTLDASAFISQQAWERIMRDNHLNPVELRDNRYNQIVHMVSAAVGAEAFYSTEDHVVRSENLDLACELDRKAAQAWIGHPYFDVIDNTSDFDTKIKRMISMVCQKVGVDTGDRLKNNARKIKYLVHGPLPPVDKFPKFQDFTVEHVYLRTNSRKTQARIRKRGAHGHHSYTYTIRKPEKLGQIVEVRTQVTQRDWNTAKGQADDQHFPIYKTRRCFLHNDQYFQLDIYREPCHTRCDGLMLLETYSTLTGDEMTQRLPSFLNIVKEVTGNPEYSMYNLSLREEWGNTSKFCVNIAGKDASSSHSSNVTEVDEDYGSSTTDGGAGGGGGGVGEGGSLSEGGSSSGGGADAGQKHLVGSSDWGTDSGNEWDGADDRRVSLCESEWDYYQKKIVRSLSAQSSTRDHASLANDDKFYEDMDKRYNGNRSHKEGDGAEDNCAAAAAAAVASLTVNGVKETNGTKEKCSANGVGI